jgi:hypothetical protein
MNRKLARISVLFLHLVLCALAGTGFVLEWKTPLDEGESSLLLGIHGEDWGEIHLWFGIAMVALVMFHLALNWRRVSKADLGGRRWISVTVIAIGVLMTVGLLFAPTPVDKEFKNGLELELEMDGHEGGNEKEED